MSEHEALLSVVHIDSGPKAYAQTIKIGQHTLISDEPASAGGADAGPPPYGLFLAGLASCTSITLRMYADRKGWSIEPIHIDLVMVRDGDVERIERKIRVAESVTLEQRTRLAEIADKTPVTKTVMRGTKIVTTVA